MPKIGKKVRPKIDRSGNGYCRVCRKDRPLSYFYEATNPKIDTNGFMSVCKDCCNDIYDSYFSIFNNLEVALDKTCEDLDVRFNPEALKQCQSHIESLINKGKKAEKVFGYYKSKLSSTGKNNDGLDSFKYRDSDKVENNKNVVNVTNQEIIDVEMIKFWGRFKDYSGEDYEILQDNYESWIRECKSDTLAEKKLYKQICLQEIEIQKLREQGKGVVKETESLQKLMDSANVKPKDINAANDPSNASVLGMVIKDIEQYRPAEYFKDKKIYSDFDGIGEYLNRFVFRPLKNLLLGSRDYDKEFNLETSEGDSDE